MSRALSAAGFAALACLAAGGCVESRPRMVIVNTEPVRSTVPAKRIADDGAGGLILPDGSRVRIDRDGGFTLPNGDYVRRDASGALNLPNGARCLPDGRGGFGCP